ncbi:MAG: hypothetical protein KH452_02780 [Clostridiales bacterium]|nr:hypothetical protein [Clostridiales bacterium]
MKFKKVSRKLAAMMMTGAMMVSMLGMTVSAARTGAVGDDGVYFTKTLNMDAAQGASTPNVTFTYTITQGSYVAATANSPEILAGIGSPVVGTAVYKAVNDESTEVDETALVKNVKVDFANVTFTKPGIYRYVITEESTNNTDITNDKTAVRYLDVYVVNDGNGYKIASQALFSGNATDVPTKDGNSYKYASKNDGFTNTYTTYELTLDKTVTGTMGDKGNLFKFTINFTNGPANGSFTYGTQKVELDANGVANVTGIELADATAAIKITGIPSTVKYTVTETINKTDGYTTTYTVNETAGTATASDTAVTSAEHTMGKINNAVVVNNHKDAVSPTGIALTIAPYILMVALAGVFAFLFLRRRNRADF